MGQRSGTYPMPTKYRVDDHVTKIDPAGKKTEMWPSWSISGSEQSSRWFVTIDGGEVPAVMANEKDGWAVIDVQKRLVSGKIDFTITRAHTGVDQAIVFGRVVVRKLRDDEEHWDSEKSFAHQQTLELHTIE
jgi:hypothetical protein